MQFNSGTTLVTADSSVGVSGKPFRLFSYSMLSGATAGVVQLRNGTSTSGVIQKQIDGVISKSVDGEFVNGLLFPLGLFVDVDANVASISINGSSEA